MCVCVLLGIKGNLGKLRHNRHMPLREWSCMNKTVTDIPHVDRETQYSIYGIMSIIQKMVPIHLLTKTTLTEIHLELKYFKSIDQKWSVLYVLAGLPNGILYVHWFTSFVNMLLQISVFFFKRRRTRYNHFLWYDKPHNYYW